MKTITVSSVFDLLRSARPGINERIAGHIAQALLSDPDINLAVRNHNAMVEDGMPYILAPARSDVERYHDLLAWSVRPDSPCEMDEQTAHLYITMRGTLCYVLGHDHDRDAIAATVANIERIMVSHGYEWIPGRGVVRKGEAGQ